MSIVEKQVIRFRPDRRIQGRAVELGNEGDHLVRRLVFDLPEVDEHQTATLMYGGRYADAIALTSEDGKWITDLTAEMVGAAGEVEGYVRVDGPDGQVWQSDAFAIVTGDVPDVEVQIERLYPTAVDQMLTAIATHTAAMAESQELLDQLAADGQAAAETAQTAAAAADGASLLAGQYRDAAEAAAGGLVQPGAEAELLEAGAQPTAEWVSDDDGKPALRLGIPKGDKGDPGSDATVTAKNIASALGYTPASPSDIPAIDSTLAVAGAGADAKAVGDAVDQISEDIFTKAPGIVVETSGSLVTIDDAAEYPAISAVSKIEPVQAGSGDPSPDNIRAITGWTGAKLTRCGKNLLPNTATTQTVNGVTFTVNADGTVTANGTASAVTRYDCYHMTSGAPDFTGCILSGCPSGGSHTTYYLRYSNVTTTSRDDVGNGVTLKVDYTGAAQVYIYIEAGITVSNLTFKPMIRLASDADASYEPYQGDTYTAEFGQTVYGGTLNWSTGVLTVDRAIKTLTESDSYGITSSWPAGLFRINIADALPVAGYATVSDIVCSHAPATTPNDLVSSADLIGIAQGNNIQIFFRFSADIATVEDMAAYAAAQYAAGTPVQVCYKLAEPIVYDLTPQQVDMLFGTNNVWSDTGDSKLVYIADTKTYIDRQIAAAVALLAN